MKLALFFLFVSAAWGQFVDLSDDSSFEAWSASTSSETPTAETSAPSSGTCHFEVRRPDGSVDHTALYKNCVCDCLSSNMADPRDIQACTERCIIPGTFDGDEYQPAEQGAKRLWDAGDFKSFYDYSLRGNGGAFGISYEMTDGMTRLPWGRKFRYRKPDDKTGQCPVGWDKLPTGMCRRGRRVNLTSEVALSENAAGFHLGMKFIPILDGGVFWGLKWNFEEDEVDTTLGVQWIKLDF